MKTYRLLNDSIIIKPEWQTVMQLTADGVSREEIAEHMGISRRTVESYMDRARYQCGCTTITHLVAEMLRSKIII